MSHAFYKYKTEAERLEHLRLQRIEKIKRQLRLARDYMERQSEDVGIAKPRPHEPGMAPVVIREETRRDEIMENRFRTETEMSAFAADEHQKRMTDLSELLKLDQNFEGELEQRLQAALARMNQRVPDSDRARQQHRRLTEKLDRIMADPTFSAEDRLRMAEQRITLYIENINYDNSALDEDLLMDYKALCILLGEDEEIVPVEELRAKVDQMLLEYEKLPEPEMVADIVEEAMESLGLQVDGSCVLDEQLEGQLFGDSECNVFISCSGSGILIEPVQSVSGMAAEEAMRQQRHVCEAERKLVGAVEERGIHLLKVYSEELPAAQIAGQEDVIFPDGKRQEQRDRLERLRERNRRRRRKKAREMTYD